MTESAADRQETDFSWKAAAAISISIVAFLFIFQPFGMSIDSVPEAFAGAGLAPLNFAALTLIHRAPLPRGPLRALIAAAILVSLNYAYLALFSGPGFSLIARVALVGGLVFAAVATWRRQENLTHEVIALRKRQADATEDIVLRGESDSEVLRIPRANLRFAKAEGNYARIAWAGADKLADRLLRTTLKDVEAAAAGALIRCHRSYLVNLGEAERIEGNSKGLTVHFADGAKAPVSRNYVDAIRSAAVTA